MLAGMAAHIELDPDRMRAGARQLNALADELGSAAARIRALDVGSGRPSDRCDELAAALGRQVVDLALAAERTRRHADELDDHEARSAGLITGIARSLG